jgi:glycosyltransferase involved in cell wall biosynthesis
MKILLSAYACGPTNTSEPGNAWRAIHNALAAGHEVWSIAHGGGYERDTLGWLAEHPMPGYHPKFFNARPAQGKRLFRGGMGGNFHYLLWQHQVARYAVRLHAEIGFDLLHHVTFGRYWMPVGMSRLGIPFVWGPVGAAESAPAAFRRELPVREQMLEYARDASRAVCRLDPALRQTARRATISIGISRETCDALRKLGARNVRQLPQAGHSDEELAKYLAVPSPPEEGPFRAICIGRLVHWKGVYLAIRTFALFARKNAAAELWIVSNGPFKKRLQKMAADSGVGDRIHFLGFTENILEKLAQAHVLMHMALHEAFGNVCMEAMAAGRPVVCLDLGGPASQVTPECGFAAPISSPRDAVEAAAAFLERISTDRALLAKMSGAARERVRRNFTMRVLGAAFLDAYRDAVELHAAEKPSLPHACLVR